MSVRALPPLAALRAFAAFAEAGSVTAAGGLLNVSHAAVSQQIRTLEEHLGLKLIVRDGRGVTLTAEGAALAETLRGAFHAIATELERLTGADALRPVRLTTTPMLAASWLMPRMGALRVTHPEIDLMINATPDRVPLAPGGYELAIRFGRGDWPGEEAELLFRTSFVIVAARGLIGDRRIESPADLLDFHWLQELGTDEVRSWLAAQGVTDRLMRGLTQLPGNLLLDGLRAGQGVGATTRAFVEPDLARGDLVVLFDDDRRGQGYFLVQPRTPPRPAVKSVIRWLRREAAV